MHTFFFEGSVFIAEDNQNAPSTQKSLPEGDYYDLESTSKFLQLLKFVGCI